MRTLTAFTGFRLILMLKPYVIVFHVPICYNHSIENEMRKLAILVKPDENQLGQRGSIKEQNNEPDFNY